MQKYHQNTQVEAKQLECMIAQKADIVDAARQYIEAGIAIVPMPYGSKRPASKGWNKRANAITSHGQLNTLDGNIGLAHAYSGTCCIDIDDYVKTDEYFTKNGIDLTSLLMATDAVKIRSGRPNRDKLLYRTPEVLNTFQHCEGKQTIVEFRCGTSNGLTVQDVLPPSIHPETGNPYVWHGDWKKIPDLPDCLTKFWLKNIGKKDQFLTPKDHNPHRKNIVSVGVPIVSMGNSNETPEIEIIKSTNQVRKLLRTKSIQKKLLNFLGFQHYESLFKNGRASVRSVIPPDNHYSGGLILSNQGEILFHDYSGAIGHQHVFLPVLYARLRVGFNTQLIVPTEKDGKLYGNVTLAVWSVRLLIDAGIVKPAQVELPPCPNLRKSVQQFYEGIKLLFQVRWAFRDHHGNPITMGRKFMSAWTGLSEDQCRDAIKDLLKAGVIHTAGQFGRARLFAPGYKAPKKVLTLKRKKLEKDK